MMCVDQGWSLAYFQVAVSILIFGTGIPSLVLQAIVPDDIREVVHRHFWLLRWGYIFYIPLMVLVVLFFVWMAHPCDTTPRLFAEIGMKYNFIQWDDVIITASIISLSMVWFLQIWYRRDRLLAQLEIKCNWRIRHKKVPDGQILDDIRYLGEQGKSRGYKIRILTIFERLAYKVQTHKNYKGNGLEDVIQAIELTLQKDIDATSFTQGILTLKHILENEPKSNVDSSTDTGAILRVLQRLGAVAISIDNERPARKILETIEFVSRLPDGTFSEAALTLYELGAAALDHERFLIAVETLCKFEAMLYRKELVTAADSFAYLGLIAHFWARGGSARQRALSSLKGIKFYPSRSDCLINVQKSFFRTTRFATADLLSKMIANL